MTYFKPCHKSKGDIINLKLKQTKTSQTNTPHTTKKDNQNKTQQTTTKTKPNKQHQLPKQNPITQQKLTKKKTKTTQHQTLTQPAMRQNQNRVGRHPIFFGDANTQKPPKKQQDIPPPQQEESSPKIAKSLANQQIHQEPSQALSRANP